MCVSTLPFIVVLLCLVQFVDADCTTIYPVLELPDTPNKLKSEDRFIDSVRTIAANHKTGTFFGQCLCTVLGRDYCKLTAIHTTGKNFGSNLLSINMVRNPFVLVHSGYEYHLRAPEVWTTKPFHQRKPTGVGANYAITTYEQWCDADKIPLHVEEHPNITYVAALTVSTS